MRLALAQLNTVVGDIEGNAGRIADALAAAGSGTCTGSSPSGTGRGPSSRYPQMISPHCGHVGSALRFRIWNWQATQPNRPLTRWPTWKQGMPRRRSASWAPWAGDIPRGTDC